MYGLISQMLRAVVSIPSNIAEGAARDSSKEFIRFLNIAKGSLAELETQLELTKEFGYIENSPEIEQNIISVRKMLIGLKKSIARWVIGDG